MDDIARWLGFTIRVRETAKNMAEDAKSQCLAKLNAVLDLVNAYCKLKGTLPTSITELSEFAAALKGIDLPAFERLMFNERDGKQFEIRWTSQVGVIVDEAVGLDGERLTSRYDRPYED